MASNPILEEKASSLSPISRWSRCKTTRIHVRKSENGRGGYWEKVDINRYNSHHTLAPSVIGMFGRYTSPGTTHVLTYQDRKEIGFLLKMYHGRLSFKQYYASRYKALQIDQLSGALITSKY